MQVELVPKEMDAAGAEAGTADAASLEAVRNIRVLGGKDDTPHLATQQSSAGSVYSSARAYSGTIFCAGGIPRVVSFERNLVVIFAVLPTFSADRIS